MDERGDSIRLTVPGERRFLGVVRLFAGGLAARLNLPYEQLDDLQIALESIILAGSAEQDVTIEVEVGEGAVRLRIGPLEGDPLRRRADGSQSLELGRLLSRLVARVESVEEEGGRWLRLEVLVRELRDGSP